MSAPGLVTLKPVDDLAAAWRWRPLPAGTKPGSSTVYPWRLFVCGARPDRSAVLAAHAQFVSVVAGSLRFEQNAPCRGFPMVLHGAVRVARGSPGGRTPELYRVTPGELCVVSTSCLFGRQSLSAHGQATEAPELVLLSPEGFARWSACEPFRHFVLGTFADRLADLMALADELGTVREIVTRLLKRFELAGRVVLGRERIDLRDSAALRALADGAPSTP